MVRSQVRRGRPGRRWKVQKSNYPSMHVNAIVWGVSWGCKPATVKHRQFVISEREALQQPTA